MAPTGQGVFPTLKVLAGLVLESINSTDRRSGRPAKQQDAGGPGSCASSIHVGTNPRHGRRGSVAIAAAAAPISAASRRPARMRLPRLRGTNARVPGSRGPHGARLRPATQNLKELMNAPTPARSGRRAERQVEEPAPKATRRSQRRSGAASSKRSRGNGTLLYGMVFGVLFAAVATVVVLYVLK